MTRPVRLRAARWAEDGHLCSFGLTEIAAGIVTGLSGGLLTGAAATGIAGGLEGAGLGAGLSAIEGKSPLTGALTGGITGGAIAGIGPALGGVIGGATGLSSGTATAIGDVAAGAAAGAGGAALTGQSPLTRRDQGGGAGLVSGISGGSTGGGPPSPGPSGTAGTAAVSASAGSTAGAGGAGAPGAVALPSGTGAGTVDLSSSGIDSYGLPAPGAGGTAQGMGLSAGGGAGFGGSAGGAVSGNQDFSGGTGGGFGSILDKLGSNPGLLLAAAPLAMDLFNGSSLPSSGTALQGQAADAGSMGRTLSAYQQSGTLPSGLQDAVTANTNASVARLKATYAQNGLSGSSMEAEAVNQVHQAATAQVATLAQQLAAAGDQLRTAPKLRSFQFAEGAADPGRRVSERDQHLCARPRRLWRGEQQHQHQHCGLMHVRVARTRNRIGGTGAPAARRYRSTHPRIFERCHWRYRRPWRQ